MGDSMHGSVRFGLAEKIMILFGGLASALALIGLSTVLPQIEAALARAPDDKLLVKMLVPVVGLSTVVGAPLAGFLVERWGMRRVLLVCSLFYVLFGTAGLYLTDLNMLLASRLLLGIFAAGISTTAMILVNTRLEGTERAKWMGWHMGAMALGMLVMFPVLGALGEQGWRWPFATYGFYGLAIGLVAVGIVEQQRPNLGDNAKIAGSAILEWFPFGFAFLCVLIGGITVIPNVYFSFVVHQSSSHSSANTALLLMSISISVALGTGVYGRLAQAMDWRRIFIISFFLFGLGQGLIAAGDSLVYYTFGAIITGMGMGWLLANVMTAGAQAAGTAFQSRVTGVLNGAMYFGQPIAVFLTNPVGEKFGPHGPFGVGAAVSALMFSCFLIVLAFKRPINAKRDAQLADSRIID